MINSYISLILLILSANQYHQLNVTKPTAVTSATTPPPTTDILLRDSLTAMFNHVKQTNDLKQSCGNNLQKFNISLEQLWSSKFQTQIKNTLVLTGLFNSYLNEEPNKNDQETLFHSLCAFMFTQANMAKAEQITKISRKFDNKIVTDHYLASIGFIRWDQEKAQCYSLQTPGINSRNDLKSLQVQRSCSALNYNDEKKLTDTLQNTLLDDKFSKYKGYELSTHADESLINCSNWHKNLQRAYNQSSQRYISSTSRLNTSGDYMNLLQNLLNDPAMANSLWCGPVYECDTKTPFRKNEWILKYSLPLIDSKFGILGAVSVKLKLNQLDLNQCPSGDPVVAGSHKCKANSECVFVSTNKFAFGSYRCKCTNGFIVNGAPLVYNGTELETQYWLMKNKKNNSYQDNYDCLPCAGQQCCSSEYMANTHYSKIDLNILKDYENRMDLFWQCRSYNMTVRILILSVQVVSLLFVVWLAAFIFYKRQNKVIKHSMWILCELMLFGAFLLYFTLIIQYFEPTTITCIAIPWFRELGFTIVYGILNLRLYKILIEFQSRKAHVVQLKDKDILRILSCIVVCVFGYLTAWTLVDLDYASEGYSILTNTSLKGFIQYPICKIKWWDYFIEMAEFLFICVGFYLLYCTRTAPSEFNERKFISLVFCFEASASTLLHIIKHSINNSIHPDTILILFFIRCHATVTVMLLLIFITKVCFLFKQTSDDICLGPRLSKIDVNDIAAMDPLKYANRKGKSNGNYDVEEFNLMEPSEIRSELKRLYTEIHIYKTKSLKHENPHIQNPTKKNRAKKIRKFSNAFMKQQNVKENESAVARTPEESVCSNDFNYSLAQTQN